MKQQQHNPSKATVHTHEKNSPLKRQEKIHLKMSSAEVVCCKQMSNVTDELTHRSE